MTALRSDEVIDLMIKEYPGKHAEYSVILQERERQRIAKEYSVSTLISESITNVSMLRNIDKTFFYSFGVDEKTELQQPLT